MFLIAKQGLVIKISLIFKVFSGKLAKESIFMIEIMKTKTRRELLQKLAEEVFGDMAKLVIDVEKGIMAAGGEMHADCEQALLDNGSSQDNLWGANIYPFEDRNSESFIEYHSLINIRPRANNRGMEIEDDKIRQRMKSIINNLLE